MSSNLWQNPFVNVLKHYNISTWKKITKGGDISSKTDKHIKCTVHEIRGSVPASNFVQLPAIASQALCLTGRFFYLIFRPHSSRHFVFHIDVATSDGINVRLSFSNIYREFKCTGSWIQFPYNCIGGRGTICGITEANIGHTSGSPAPLSSRWTVLCLDLPQVLTTYFTRRFMHVRGIQLCANMSVKTIVTSDQEYCPGVSMVEARSNGLLAFPREVAFPLPRGDRWEDLYDFIRFPSSATNQMKTSPDSIHSRTAVKSLLSSGGKGKPVHPELESDGNVRKKSNKGDIESVNTALRNLSMNPEVIRPKEVNLERPLENQLSMIQTLTSPRDGGSGLAKGPLRLPPPSLPTADDLPMVNLSGFDSAPIIDISAHQQVEHRFKEEEEVHVLARPPPEAPIAAEENVNQGGRKSLRPEPIMILSHAIGITPGWRDLMFSERSESVGGSEVVYGCHAIVVALEVKTGRQRFFVGHSSRVSCIALDSANHLLASGSDSLVRLWQFSTCKCLAVTKIPARNVRLLAFDPSGEILVGVGRDDQGRHVVVVWKIHEERGGDAAKLVMLARATVEADIRRIKVLPRCLPSNNSASSMINTGHRMISVGRNNIRLWRVKENHLRSSPIDLGEYAGAQLEFTDCSFDSSRSYFDDQLIVYACALSGHIFCIDVAHFRVDSVKRLLPTEDAIASGRLPHPNEPSRHNCRFDGGIGLVSITVGPGESFVATGSQDGFLRLWPADFGHVYLEAEHDSAVTSVIVSPDARRLIVATGSASIGQLDLSSRSYSTFMRSHTSSVSAVAIDPVRRHIATASSADGSVRIWHAENRQQLYDFTPKDASTPTSLVYHPREHVLACGFSSGVLRLFDVSKSTMETEQRLHRSSINDLIFSPTGHRLYSCDALGALCLLDITKPPFHVRRLLERAVVKTDGPSPGILSIDREGTKLAYIGPTTATVTLADAHSLEDLIRIDVSLIERQIALDQLPPPTQSALESSISGAARLVFSPNGRHLLLSTNNGVLIRLSAYDGQLLAARRNEKGIKIAAGEIQTSALAVSPSEGRFIITNSGKEGLLRVSDVSLKTDVRTQRFIGHGEAVAKVVFSPDSSTVISVSDSILIWQFLGEPGSRIELQPFDEEVLGLNIAERDVEPCPSIISPIGDHATLEESQVSIPVVRVNPGLPNGNHVEDEACTDPPNSISHFQPREHVAAMAHRRYLAPPPHCGIQLVSMIGYSGRPGGDTLIWDSVTGFFAYVCGRVVIVEDLDTGDQRHLLAGEIQEITTIAITSDRRFLVSAGSGQDGIRPAQLCVWDIRRLSEVDDVEGALLQCRDCHAKGSAVQAMAFSPDNRFLLTLGNHTDGTMQLWDTNDPNCWEMVSRIGLPSAQHTITWDPMHDYTFVTAGAAGTIHWWKIDKSVGLGPLALITSIESPSEMTNGSRDGFEITSLIFLPPPSTSPGSSSPSQAVGSVLVAASNTGRMALWQDGDCVLHWEADRSEITFVLVLCNSEKDEERRREKRCPRLVTGSASGCLRLWDLGHLVERLCGYSTEIIEHNAGIVPTVMMSRESVFSVSLCSAAVDPDGELCVVGTSDGGLWLVDWSTSGPPTQLVAPLGNAVIPSLDWSPGSHPGWLAVVSKDDGSVTVLDALKSREQVCRIAVAGEAKANVVTFAPTGCRLAVGYIDGSVRHFDVQRVELLDKWTPLSSTITALRFSLDEKVIICGGSDGLVSVLALATSFGVIRQISDHRGAAITSIDVVSDRWLAASVDRRISVWRADWTCDLCEMIDWLTFPAYGLGKELEPSPPALARFASPHENDVIIFSVNGVEPRLNVYSLSTRQVLRTINLCDHWADCLDISGRDPLIAIGSRHWLMKLVDIYEGSFQDYIQHGDGVMTLRFFPDGRFLASASRGEILIWKVRN